MITVGYNPKAGMAVTRSGSATNEIRKPLLLMLISALTAPLVLWFLSLLEALAGQARPQIHSEAAMPRCPRETGGDTAM